MRAASDSSTSIGPLGTTIAFSDEEGGSAGGSGSSESSAVVEIGVTEGTPGGRGGVKGSSLGRNAELISPIPTKKSSADQVYMRMTAVWKRTARLTRDHFNKVWTPFPDIRTVINDNNHTLITGEESLQALLGQTLSEQMECEQSNGVRVSVEGAVIGYLLPLSSLDRIRPPKNLPSGSMAAQTSSA